MPHSELPIEYPIRSPFKDHAVPHLNHSKVTSYINPCLIAANSSKLGFYIGPICFTAVCIPDDTYLLSNDPRSLQQAINILDIMVGGTDSCSGLIKPKSQLQGQNKTCNTTKRLTYDEKLQVSEDNQQFGLVVSVTDEEMKNFEKIIDSARKKMFALLGNIFSYKCKLVQLHVYSVLTLLG